MNNQQMTRSPKISSRATTTGKQFGEPFRSSMGNFRRCPECSEEILNSVHEDVILCTADLRIVWANSATLASLHQESGGILAQKCHEALHSNPDPCENCPVRRSFESGKPETACIKSPKGRFFELQALPLLNEDGTVEQVLEFALDVTDKVHFHSEALRTEHFSSLGELSAGIAHEINNPINGIINYAQMLANRYSHSSNEYDIADRIIVEGERIAGIVHSLLTFAGQGSTERKGISLLDLLTDCLSLTQAQIKEDGIHLKLNIELDLPEMLANNPQMRQVFLNLISNARHALNDRFPEAHADKVLKISGDKIHNEFGSFLHVEFYDQGTGVPPEAVKSIFIPFFTTKSGKNGVGLGLSTSRNIIIQHNGTIRVESRYGEYTKVMVEIPVLANKPAVSAETYYHRKLFTDKLNKLSE